MTRTKVISSNIFRRSLVASGGFILLALALLWIVGSLRLWQYDRMEWQAILSEIAEIEEIYHSEGLQALLEKCAIDGQIIWDEGSIFQRLEEQQPLFALRDDEDELLGGFEGLWSDEDLPLVWLDHPNVDDPLRSMVFTLDDGIWGVVGRFVPEGEHYWSWLISQMSYALVFVGLPLSLTMGYFLSRGVLGRIEAISDTAEAVSSGRMQSRVKLQGTGDEFDRLSSKINDMLDRVSQLNRNIEAVSVGVAHDLKTPLANIGGRLELIRRDLNDAEATEGHVEAAESYLDSILRVFDALLRLGEVEAGRRRIAFEQLSLSELVTDMVASYKALFDDAQKTMTTSIDDNCMLNGDRELLQQLLSNLIENALEHSRDAAQVLVELVQFDGQLTFRVADDGPGISPNEHDRLFERFYRADRSRGSPGNGLGLSLVKAIAELHDATVAVADGQPGAVFEVRFHSEAKDYKTV